jgi:predicted PurR-regulated permease PerM
MSLSTFFLTYVVKNRLVIAVVVILVGWLSWYLRHMILWAYVAFIFNAAALPLVNRLDQKLPRSLAAAIPIVIFLLLFIMLFIPLSTISLEQAQGFIRQISTFGTEILAQIPALPLPENTIEMLIRQMGDLNIDVFRIPGQVAGFFLFLFLMLFTAYYLLLDHDRAVLVVTRLFPKPKRPAIARRLEYVENQLGQWVRGQLLVAVAIGISTFIAYIIIGLPYAVSLAYFAMLMELIPNLGPVLAITPALIIALTLSPLTTFYTLIAFVIIQTLESYILVPKVMERVIGLHPLIVVFSVIIGSSLFGILGALVAVPFVATINSIINYENHAHES